MKTAKILKLIIRLLVGCLFITTAVLKLFSLDEFEVYIYSFQIFSFVFSTVVARMVIAAEMLLGICLMSKMLYKHAWYLTQLMLIGFTGLLVYTAIFRNDSNCHCFGSFIEVNPVLSIVKNLVTIGLLLFVRKEEDYQFRGKKAALIAAFVISVIVPFCVFPMDKLYNHFVSPYGNINTIGFAKLEADSNMSTYDISNGNYITAVYASGCKYCKLSAKKFNQIMMRNNLDAQHFQILIWGDSASVRKFREESGCTAYPFHIIDPFTAIDIVNGKFPFFIMTRNDSVVKAFDYRGIAEDEIADFLK